MTKRKIERKKNIRNGPIEIKSSCEWAALNGGLKLKKHIRSHAGKRGTGNTLRLPNQPPTARVYDRIVNGLTQFPSNSPASGKQEGRYIIFCNGLYTSTRTYALQ